jgi:hypothetical protein
MDDDAGSVSLLAPLRVRPFRLLTAGTAVNLLGNGVAPIALSFAVLDVTGSTGALGLVVGVRSLCNVLLLLYGGVVADRLPRGLVLVGSSALSAASQGAVAALVLTGRATVPLLLALSALNGACAAFALPASVALLPQTLPPWLLRAGTAIQRLLRNGAQILGASVGGVLVAGLGPGWGLAVDAVSFAVAGVCFGRVRAPRAGAGAARRAGLVTELREGWQEFTAHTWLWVVVVAFFFLEAAMACTVEVLGPAVADHTMGRSGWGLAVAAHGLGMVAGGVLGLRFRPRRLLLFGCACVGGEALTPLGLVLSPTTGAMTVVAFLAGVGIEQFGIAWQAALQQEIPAGRLARVSAYDALGSFAAIPFAQLGVGPVVGAVGTRAALLGASGLIAASTAAMVAVRGVRSLRTATPVAVTPPVVEPVGVTGGQIAQDSSVQAAPEAGAGVAETSAETCSST